MADKSAVMLIVSLILGASIVGASLVVQTSIDKTASELGGALPPRSGWSR